MVESTSGIERREYFRCGGTLYLYVATSPIIPNADLPNLSTLHEQLDTTQVQIKAFQERIEYERPEQLEYWRMLLRLLADVQEQHGRLARQLPSHQTMAQRQAVIISGSGMQFFSPTPYAVDSTVYLWMAFPEYPYATIITEARVVKSDPLGETPEKVRIAVEFLNLPEHDRDSIIKFVNHRERTQRLERTRKS